MEASTSAAVIEAAAALCSSARDPPHRRRQVWAPRIHSLEWALHRQQQVRVKHSRSLNLVTAGDEATKSITGSCAALAAGATLLAVRRGAGATYSISIPSITSGTGTSTVCSMMRSEFRSCGTTTCCRREWAICSTVRCWMRSSVWVGVDAPSLVGAVVRRRRYGEPDSEELVPRKRASDGLGDGGRCSVKGGQKPPIRVRLNVETRSLTSQTPVMMFFLMCATLSVKAEGS